MKPHDCALSELRRELGFLDRGGYRVESQWRLPLFFEDSPICRRHGEATCPSSCALLASVPAAFRDQAAPCRHIPLNDAGETLHALYRTATMEETEAAVRSWLLRLIGASAALHETRAEDKQVA